MVDYDLTLKRLRRCGLFKCRECEYESIAGCRMKLNADAADAIEELLAKVPTWISVEERLPEVEQSVLFCVFGRSVGEGTYRGHDGFHHVWKMYAVAGTYWDDEVTHWMPLPAPPKGVE